MGWEGPLSVEERVRMNYGNTERGPRGCVCFGEGETVRDTYYLSLVTYPTSITHVWTCSVSLLSTLAAMFVSLSHTHSWPPTTLEKDGRRVSFVQTRSEQVPSTS